MLTLGDGPKSPTWVFEASRRLSRSQSRRHILIFASMILNSFIGLSGAMSCAGIEQFTVECDNNTFLFTDFNMTPQWYTETICDSPQVKIIVDIQFY